MNTVSISLNIPVRLFKWLKRAVESGSFASVDEAIAAGLERLRAESDYLLKVGEWADEFEGSDLHRRAAAGEPEDRRIREEAAFPNVVYDEAYHEAMDEVYPKLGLHPQTELSIPSKFTTYDHGLT